MFVSKGSDFHKVFDIRPVLSEITCNEQTNLPLYNISCKFTFQDFTEFLLIMLKVRSFYVSSLRIPLEHPITFWLCTSLDLSDEAKSTHEKLRTPVFTLFLPQENSVVEQKIDFDLGFSEYCITSESPMNKHAHIGRWIVFVGKQVNIFRYEFQTALFLNEMIILYSNLQIENNNKRQERIT